MKILRYHVPATNSAKKWLTIDNINFAIAVGKKFGISKEIIDCDCLFVGPDAVTAQSALAFLCGLGFSAPKLQIIDNIGADFDEHNPDTCPASATNTIKTMFSKMKQDEVAIAFGNLTIAQLAYWDINGQSIMPEEFHQLNPLEGIEFIEENDGTITAIEKILVD